MSVLIRTLARAGRQNTTRCAINASVSKPRYTPISYPTPSLTTPQTRIIIQRQQLRSTSWIAWEQPDPALYARPLSNEKQHAARNNQEKRDVGESVTAPSTTAVGGGSQEVATSGKTLPPTVQGGTLPFDQKRSLHTHAESVEKKSDSENNDDGDVKAGVDVNEHEHEHEDPYLPKTLLRIPGVSSTWPGEDSSTPDQKRVRKISFSNANTSTSNNTSTAKKEEDDGSSNLEANNAFLRALKDYEAVSAAEANDEKKKAKQVPRANSEDQKRYSFPRDEEEGQAAAK